MFPATPSYNLLDGLPSNSVICCEHPIVNASGSMAFSYFQNLMVFQLRVRASLSSILSPSAFLASILAVIVRSSKKQMAWITARTIIAFVQHMKPFWNRAFLGFPSESMRSSILPIHGKGTITVIKSTGWPFPAFAIWECFKMIPKSFLQRLAAPSGKSTIFTPILSGHGTMLPDLNTFTSKI